MSRHSQPTVPAEPAHTATYTTAGETPTPGPGEATLLELEDVDASYGPYRALFGVSFKVRSGSATALVGPNGAGKTTIARICTGLVKPTAGKVFFEGADIAGTPAYQIARLGISHAPEGRSIFATLTVEENLKLEFQRALGPSRVNDALARAYELFPRLGERRTQLAGTMSGGEQRMLSLARVLVHPPKLLIADELGLGLAPIVVDEVFGWLRTIRSAGTALVVIEEEVHRAIDLADDVVVMQKGRVDWAGPKDAADDIVSRIMPATP